MDASLLHVVSVVANPMLWDSRYRLARRFISHMLDSGVDLTIIEVAYGDHGFQLADTPNIRWIGVRAKTMSWLKESALNRAIRSLPEDARFIAWLDADIEFRDPNWARNTLHALQFVPVLQPWSEALDLGPRGEAMTVKNKDIQRSFGWVWRTTGDVTNWWRKHSNGEPYGHYPHCGYAWAATMDWFEAVGGLLDFSGLGAADHQMSLSMVNQVGKAIHGLSSPNYVARVKAWGDRCYSVTQGHVGYVQGRIEHAWHGDKSLRKYVERWDILNQHAFDPNLDLILNRHGILELAGNKPAMTRDFHNYFAQRDEDSNTRLDSGG